LQAQVDTAQRPGATSAEQQWIKDLEREVRDLKEANEILKAAFDFLRAGAVRHEAPGVSIWLIPRESLVFFALKP